MQILLSEICPSFSWNRGLYKTYWKSFPPGMLKTLLKALKTLPLSRFSTIWGAVFHRLWKTFQHNGADKTPCQVGKLLILDVKNRQFATKPPRIPGLRGGSEVFPTPDVDKSRKVHPRCFCAAHQSAMARMTGAALAPPPPYSMTTAAANSGDSAGP